MRQEIGMEDIANVMIAISDYESRASYFSQMGGSDDNKALNEYWNTKIVKRTEKTWMTELEFRQWKDIELHLISQTWGNTSCGWQGIGGAAMTPAYTTIIENKWYNLSFIYYSGKLAYICEVDDKYNDYKQKGYRGLPGCLGCREKLTVIFKSC
jgi:hypothetical protein